MLPVVCRKEIKVQLDCSAALNEIVCAAKDFLPYQFQDGLYHLPDLTRLFQSVGSAFGSAFSGLTAGVKLKNGIVTQHSARCVLQEHLLSTVHEA